MRGIELHGVDELSLVRRHGNRGVVPVSPVYQRLATAKRSYQQLADFSSLRAVYFEFVVLENSGGGTTGLRPFSVALCLILR